MIPGNMPWCKNYPLYGSTLINESSKKKSNQLDLNKSNTLPETNSKNPFVRGPHPKFGKERIIFQPPKHSGAFTRC